MPFKKGYIGYWKGIHLSEEHKRKCSEKLKGHTCYLKGKTWEEYYGKEKADELKRIKSEKMMGHFVSPEIRRKISEVHKGIPSKTKGIPRSTETTRKIRISAIKRIESQIKNGGQIHPAYNTLACKIFEDINKTYNLQGQHAENGGEYKIKDLGYFLDYFDKQNMVIIEYYEKHHYKDENILNEKTLQREKEIKEYFPHYQFLRINAYNFNELKMEYV